MRLDNTPESQFHNERVVMLLALVDRKVDEQAFKDQRYQAYRAAGKGRSEARRLTQEEFENPGGCLLEVLKNRINETNAKLPQIKTAMTDILNGTAPDLEAAYRVIEDDGIYLMMNAVNAVRDIQNGIKNYAAREKDITKQAKEWETIGCTVLRRYEIRDGAPACRC